MRTFHFVYIESQQDLSVHPELAVKEFDIRQTDVYWLWFVSMSADPLAGSCVSFVIM